MKVTRQPDDFSPFSITININTPEERNNLYFAFVYRPIVNMILSAGINLQIIHDIELALSKGIAGRSTITNVCNFVPLRDAWESKHYDNDGKYINLDPNNS